MPCSPRLGDDLCHLIHLSLGTAERTEPLLGELASTLILAVTEQFNDTTLIWRQSGDLPHNFSDECRALADATFGAGNPGSWLAGCDLVSVI